MPIPVSLIVAISYLLCGLNSANIVIEPFKGVNFIAFDNKFTITYFNRLSSPVTL